MLVSEIWGPLIRLGTKLLRPGAKIKPGQAGPSIPKGWPSQKPGQAANANKPNPPEVKALTDKLTGPRSKDAIEYSKALKGQKIDKFQSSGDPSHLKGLSPSEVFQAAEKIKKGSGAEALKNVFKSKPKGK